MNVLQSVQNVQLCFLLVQNYPQCLQWRSLHNVLYTRKKNTSENSNVADISGICHLILANSEIYDSLFETSAASG